MSSDSEEMRSSSNSPNMNIDHPECTDSSSESRTTPEPNDDEKSQRNLFELSLAAATALNHLNQRSIPIYPHKHREERKRRRVIGNSDNTLDGLVAKRADLDPFAKRYQTENEAIELPDDEIEMKRLETDPDVSTRMCSICGYQGKWVSEMIRHKRVHTNERPFKCKYCNRTSKWKADLIRHVAKTHGIRVVSKYSRSKAFDVNSEVKDEMIDCVPTKKKNLPPTMTNLSQQTFGMIKEEVNSPSSSSSIQSTSSLPVFRCLMCLFEQDSIDQVINHLHTVHNCSPFECLQCKKSFEEVSSASSHCSMTIPSSCTPLSIKINFQPIYGQKSSSTSVSTATTSSPCSIRSENDGTISALSTRIDDEEINTIGTIICSECPFRTSSDEKLLLHKLGHETPKGLMNYKCVFCNFYNKKKSTIEKHMQLHTTRPEDFMQQVERNLITPAMLYENITKHSTTTLPTLNLSTPTLFTPNNLNLAAATSLLSAASLYSPLSTPITPNLPDLTALSQLTSNPLLAFGLCSLLDMQKTANNLLKFEHVA
uniref:C2H2-type domain-containing protein n=1 Tax=Panagrolaimus sp. JU765 TaxID=591449 RepID=A0AC34RCF4_9BILA